MNIDWLENIKEDQDKDWLELSKTIDEYDNIFNNINDYNSAICDDNTKLKKRLEECIRLEIPYSELYGNDVKNKYHPVGCDSIKAIIDHEFGHQLDDLLNLKNNKEIINNYNNFKKMSRFDKRNSLSLYANKNIEEFIAECYSEYVNNSKCRNIAKEVGGLIDEIYKKRFN